LLVVRIEYTAARSGPRFPRGVESRRCAALAMPSASVESSWPWNCRRRPPRCGNSRLDGAFERFVRAGYAMSGLLHAGGDLGSARRQRGTGGAVPAFGSTERGKKQEARDEKGEHEAAIRRLGNQRVTTAEEDVRALTFDEQRCVTTTYLPRHLLIQHEGRCSAFRKGTQSCRSSVLRSSWSGLSSEAARVSGSGAIHVPPRKQVNRRESQSPLDGQPHLRLSTAAIARSGRSLDARRGPRKGRYRSCSTRPARSPRCLQRCSR
jgi:hypothetical protein